MTTTQTPPPTLDRQRWFSMRDLASILYAAITAVVVVAGTWYAQAQQLALVTERQNVVRATLVEHRERMTMMDNERQTLKDNQHLMIATSAAVGEQLKAINMRLEPLETQLDRVARQTR
mgnify:CR=1 FL=1